MDKKQDNLRRIAEMWLSEDVSDNSLALDWFTTIAGKRDALANMLLLSAYRPIDEEVGGKVCVNEDNYWDMSFEKRQLPFSKNHFHFIGNAEIMLEGEILEYFPIDACSKNVKLDGLRLSMYKAMTIIFHREGIKLYSELFHYANQIVRLQTK